MRQKAFQKEPGQFPLRGLVARRLVGKFSDTELQAVGKQIFDYGDGGATFCMRKVLYSVCALSLGVDGGGQGDLLLAHTSADGLICRANRWQNYVQATVLGFV